MLKIYESVRRVPPEAQKIIGGGKLKGMTDINPMWRIKKLTETFGTCGFGWYYEVTNKWTETAGTEVCAFVDINLFIKIDGEWSKPISGTGGSKMAATEKNGIYVSDECYKMATTDALSVACKQLGMGADVYWDKDKTKYTTPDKPKEPLNVDEKGYPPRSEMVTCLNRFYGEGTQQRQKLFDCWKIKNIDEATNEMLMVVYNKYGGAG